MKRLDGAKDYGNMLGAHGGFMDRFDGVNVALTFGVLHRVVVDLQWTQ